MAHLIVSARLAVAQGGTRSELFSLPYTSSLAGTYAACIPGAPAALQESWRGGGGR